MMTTRRAVLKWAALAMMGLMGLVDGASAQAQEKVVLWHAYRADEAKALEQVAATFNQSNKKIQLELVRVPFDALPDKVSNAIPQGKGPSLFIFAHDRVGDWADKKIIEPLGFFVDDKLKAEYMPQTLQPLTYRKEIYGLPLAYKTLVLYYNKSLVSTPPKTTDELIATAKELTNKGERKYGLCYENTDFHRHSMWLYGFGGAIFDSTGKLVLNTPQAAASFQFAADLRNKHGVVPEEVTSTLQTSLFNDGKVAMVINGPWFTAEIKPGLNYGVAPLPTISANNQPARPFMGSEAVMMSSRAANKDAAFEVMKYLTGAEASKVRMQVGKQTVATLKAYEGNTDPMVKVYQQQLANSVAMPNTPQMLMVWSPAATALNKAVTGGAKPAEALKQAQTQIEQAIKSSRR
ncbi:MAG: extracellular solute-binding protein [Myxococcota bacterium]